MKGNLDRIFSEAEGYSPHEFLSAVYAEIKTQYWGHRLITEEDAEKAPYYYGGRVGESIPWYGFGQTSNIEEAKDIMVNYFGVYWCASAIAEYLKTLPKFTVPGIKSAIGRIERFAESTNAIDFQDACEAKNPTLEEEYVKIVNGYYDINLCEYGGAGSNNVIAGEAYGRYIWFYDFLRNKLKQLENIASGKPPKDEDAKQISREETEEQLVEGSKLCFKMEEDEKEELAKGLAIAFGHSRSEEIQAMRQIIEGNYTGSKIHFSGAGTVLIELFRRLYYHSKMTGSFPDVISFLNTYFTYTPKRAGGSRKQPQGFKADTYSKLYYRGEGEPPKTDRICLFDWLPHIHYTVVKKRK